MFDAAHAALLRCGAPVNPAETKTHRGLIAAFGQYLVKPGLFSADLGRSLNQVERVRLLADYTGEEVDTERTVWVVEQAESFLEAVQGEGCCRNRFRAGDSVAAHGSTTPPTPVQSYTTSPPPASEGVQRFLREALRVLRAATDISGDVSRATFWYRNEPLTPFGYKTAETLVSEGRTEDVLRYVMSLEAGAAG